MLISSETKKAEETIFEIRQRLGLNNLLKPLAEVVANDNENYPKENCEDNNKEKLFKNLEKTNSSFSSLEIEKLKARIEDLKIRRFFLDLKTKKDEGVFTCSTNDHEWLKIEFNDPINIQKHRRAKNFLEEIHRLQILEEDSSAQQISESIIAKAQLPNVTWRREKLATQLREFIPNIQNNFDNELVKELEKIKKASKYQREEDIIREVTSAAIKKISQKVKDQISSTNYLEAEKPIASLLDYEIIHVDDADYRTYKDHAIDTASQYIWQPQLFMVGQRQFGRNYRNGGMPAAFQSGGNAYWTYTNIYNSLIGVVPSWGSCVSYSARAFKEGSRWVKKDPYTSTIGNLVKKILPAKNEDKNVLEEKPLWEGKFLPSRLFNWVFKVEEKFETRRNESPYFAKALSVIKPVFKTADFVYTIPGLLGVFSWPLALLGIPFHARDALHFLARRGYKIAPDNFERPLDSSKIIEKPLLKDDAMHEIFGIFDSTTESEDIATGVWYFRKMPFLNDKSENWYVRTRRSLFDPKPLFRSQYIEGIGPLGGHSEDINGANTTFYARWARGNLGIFWDVAYAPLGIVQKVRYLSLTAFWMTGAFRPILNFIPLAFLLGGEISMLVGGGGLGLTNFSLLVSATFGLNMAAFLYSMHTRGNKWYSKDTLGCLLIEWAGLHRMMQSFYEGFILGERPPFKPSPKEVVVPIKAPMSELWFQNSLLLANISAFTYSLLSAGGGGSSAMLLASGWAGLHAFFGANALYGPFSINKGIYKDEPYLESLRSLKEHFCKTPKYKRDETPAIVSFQAEEGKLI
jgi:hypothetical protein